MALTFLLDSVILIDYCNGSPQAIEFLRDVRRHAAVSVITRAELLVGFDHPPPAVFRFLDAFPTLLIDGPVADAAARLRRRYRWKLPDAFQAALAQIHGLCLATRNVRDFPPDRFAFVLQPYEI